MPCVRPKGTDREEMDSRLIRTWLAFHSEQHLISNDDRDVPRRNTCFYHDTHVNKLHTTHANNHANLGLEAQSHHPLVHTTRTVTFIGNSYHVLHLIDLICVVFVSILSSLHYGYRNSRFVLSSPIPLMTLYYLHPCSFP
ncbi:hypothetical protein IAQ61_001512 [Plenodomus lingam]|uniref:uncharacterized protein n=1 Tax=Leptosphaeria maculans TaxID=5022 RepID=UPI00332BCA74|nr:hypothetical protein IAQ61_001512 [Plenodomus lingam]